MIRKLVAPAVAFAMVGASGLAMIRTNEGAVYHTYRDPVGIITACFGHTGPELRMGQTFTKAQCDALLTSDIIYHQNYLVPGRRDNCIGNVQLNQNQLDALTDFTFNVGPRKFCKSRLAQKVRSSDFNGAGLEFTKWVYASINGKPTVLPGLVQRRTEEKCVFGAVTGQAERCLPSGALRAILR